VLDGRSPSPGRGRDRFAPVSCVSESSSLISGEPASTLRVRFSNAARAVLVTIRNPVRSRAHTARRRSAVRVRVGPERSCNWRSCGDGCAPGCAQRPETRLLPPGPGPSHCRPKLPRNLCSGPRISLALPLTPGRRRSQSPCPGPTCARSAGRDWLAARRRSVRCPECQVHHLRARKR
jgi:hypothetical protein